MLSDFPDRSEVDKPLCEQLCLRKPGGDLSVKDLGQRWQLCRR